MRGFTVAAQNRTVVHIFLAQIAVWITDHSDRQIRAGYFTDCFQDVMITGADLLDFAGTVQKQINPVDLLQVRPDRIRETAFDVIKRVFRDHAVAAGVSVNRADRFNSGRGIDVRHVHLAQTVLAEGHVVMVNPSFRRWHWIL